MYLFIYTVDEIPIIIIIIIIIMIDKEAS